MRLKFKSEPSRKAFEIFRIQLDEMDQLEMEVHNGIKQSVLN